MPKKKKSRTGKKKVYHVKGLEKSNSGRINSKTKLIFKRDRCNHLRNNIKIIEQPVLLILCQKNNSRNINQNGAP